MTNRAITMASEVLAKQVQNNNEFLRGIAKMLDENVVKFEDVALAVSIANATISALQAGIAGLMLLVEEDGPPQPGRWREI